MKCSYCKGAGKIKAKEADPSGKKEYEVEQPCQKCNGTGEHGCPFDVGASVVVALKVTNFHQRRDGAYDLELSRDAGGRVEHVMTCDAGLVQKG